jgi:CheY-like chemotaxis protein
MLPPRTVLVVDDDAIVRRVVQGHLSDAGYRIFEAEDGQEALEVLARIGVVDLVIVDIVMPRLDGPAFLARLTADNPDQPVLCISAYPADVLAAYGGDSPAHPFLSKPFTRVDLLTQVEGVLTARDAATEPPERG